MNLTYYFLIWPEHRVTLVCDNVLQLCPPLEMNFFEIRNNGVSVSAAISGNKVFCSIIDAVSLPLWFRELLTLIGASGFPSHFRKLWARTLGHNVSCNSEIAHIEPQLWFDLCTKYFDQSVIGCKTKLLQILSSKQFPKVISEESIHVFNTVEWMVLLHYLNIIIAILKEWMVDIEL